MRFKKIKLALPITVGWGFWILTGIILFTKYSGSTPLKDFYWIDQIKFFIGIAFPIIGTITTIVLDWKWSSENN